MGRANFQQVFSEYGSASAGDYSSVVETLEHRILDHSPSSVDEVVSMLDVIIPDVEGGGRSDGRDVRALCSIRTYLQEAQDGAFPVLDKLRDDGVIKSWGQGTNKVEPIEIGLELTGPRADGMLLAGRYTILDHESALQRLMPLATKKKVEVIVGGPYNSGALVGGDHFEYGKIPPEIAEKVKKISALCETHKVPIKAAALHFSLSHPAVVATVPGSSKPSRIAEDVAALAFAVPDAFWRDLRSSGAVSPAAPLPIDR